MFPPDHVRHKLQRFGQDHVLAWWDKLDEAQRGQLLEQVQSIDLDELRRLYEKRDEQTALPDARRIVALPRPVEDASLREKHVRLGEEAFRRGAAAFLVVAGGQGSRLGFEHPKGMFPIGPVSNKSLFQFHVEKIVALRRRYSAALPLLVMTSPATDVETRRFFDEHKHFGLPGQDVHFFCQAIMPALDLTTGKLLLESKGELFVSPNGHGGTLTGLAASGLLELLQKRGIRTISYFQVDNPMIDLGDRDFLGQHLAQNAEVSSKVLAKQSPTDKLGNFVLIDGRCGIIEYSDLPQELAEQTDAEGRLLFWAGSPAIHLFDVDFVQRILHDGGGLPWHLARKKVPYLNEKGERVEPAKENALKFERFIFDVLPQAERWTAVLTTHKEFAPLKNATGPDSPQTVRQALTDQAADWLEQARVPVPRDAWGKITVPLEISPLFALDAEEAAQKITPDLRIDKPLYLE